jgi:hypothetical protein
LAEADFRVLRRLRTEDVSLSMMARNLAVPAAKGKKLALTNR